MCTLPSHRRLGSVAVMLIDLVVSYRMRASVVLAILAATVSISATPISFGDLLGSAKDEVAEIAGVIGGAAVGGTGAAILAGLEIGGETAAEIGEVLL